jgi:hypothetical protein
MIPAGANSPMLPDADGRPKLNYNLRTRRYYSKGEAKKRSKNQISHFFSCGHVCKCVAVRAVGVSTHCPASAAERRVLNPNHDTRPKKIQASLEALGKRVVTAYDDAA